MSRKRARTSSSGSSRKRARTSSSGSSGMRALARYVSQGTGAAAGYYADGIPGLFQGASLAGEVFDYATGISYPDPTIDDAALNVSRSDVYQTKNNQGMAIWKGRFKRPTYRTKTIEGEYASRGYVQRRETNGVISDPHCFYIGHSIYDIDMMVGTLCGSLLRKLFLKCGIPVNDRFQEIPTSAFNFAPGFQIEFSVVDDVGGVTVIQTYNLVDGDSLTGAITACSLMQNWFKDYLKNDLGTPGKPYMLIGFLEDRYQLTPELNAKRIAAKIDLEEEILDMKIYSSLIVQNRTAAALGASTTQDTDRSDVIPLKGRIYEFRNSDPRLRITNSNQNLIDQVPIDGAILIRSAQLGAEWQDVPPPKYFANCNKSTAVKLGVGQMKKTVLLHHFNGTLYNFLLKFQASRNLVDGGVTYAVGVQAGKCQIIGFEEQMRTPKNNPIKMNYERQLVVGCALRTKKKAPLKVGLATSERNNLAP